MTIETIETDEAIETIVTICTREHLGTFGVFETVVTTSPRHARTPTPHTPNGDTPAWGDGHKSLKRLQM